MTSKEYDGSLLNLKKFQQNEEILMDRKLRKQNQHEKQIITFYLRMKNFSTKKVNSPTNELKSVIGDERHITVSQ